MGPILRPPRRRQGAEQRRQGGAIRLLPPHGTPYSGGVEVRSCPPVLRAGHRGAGADRCRVGSALVTLALAALPTLAVASATGDDSAAALPPAMTADLARWTQERAEEAGPRPGARIEVELGSPDPRLRLAACARAEPYLPVSSRPWGRTRIGLRCADGPVKWNITLPVQVRVLADAPVLREPLAAGTVLEERHFTQSEVDWAAERAAPLDGAADILGQRLARALPAGAALRPDDLQRRRWFAAGDRVRVDATGAGWRASTEGQALSAGLDGQRVRVRTEGGRVITGLAVGERRVEVPL